jgi:ATP adenylyltransferase
VTKPLWAPWRMEYIAAEKPGGCIFCDYPAEEGEEADRRHLIVHRGERAYTILNRYPYNSGHLLVVPGAHVAAPEDLAPGLFADLDRELLRALAALRRAYRPEGLNLGMNLGQVAGAGIADHLHWHVVPRWNGDTNFMPVIGDPRVVPEALDATWARLRAAFAAPGP